MSERIKPQLSKLITARLNATEEGVTHHMKVIAEKTDTSLSLVEKVIYGIRPITKLSKTVVEYADGYSKKVAKEYLKRIL